MHVNVQYKYKKLNQTINMQLSKFWMLYLWCIIPIQTLKSKSQKYTLLQLPWCVPVVIPLKEQPADRAWRGRMHQPINVWHVREEIIVLSRLKQPLQASVELGTTVVQAVLTQLWPSVRQTTIAKKDLPPLLNATRVLHHTKGHLPAAVMVGCFMTFFSWRKYNFFYWNTIFGIGRECL